MVAWTKKTCNQRSDDKEDESEVRKFTSSDFRYLLFGSLTRSRLMR